MTVRIEIDPSVRVLGSQTFAGFGDCSPLVPGIGEEVTACVTEMRAAAPGVVTGLDYVRRLVYLSVEWASLIDETAERLPQL